MPVTISKSENLLICKRKQAKKKVRQPQELQMQRGSRCNSETTREATLANPGIHELFSSEMMPSIRVISGMDIDSIMACERYCLQE